jgi:hypothetical protein
MQGVILWFWFSIGSSDKIDTCGMTGEFGAALELQTGGD